MAKVLGAAFVLVTGTPFNNININKYILTVRFYERFFHFGISHGRKNLPLKLNQNCFALTETRLEVEI